jgi:hypothetical protein
VMVINLSRESMIQCRGMLNRFLWPAGANPNIDMGCAFALTVADTILTFAATGKP